MRIRNFISGSVTEVVQGLLQAQKAVALYGVELKNSGGTAGYSELDFDLAVTSRTNHDRGGDVELSVMGMDVKLGKNNDWSKSTINRLRFSVEFSIPQEQLQKITQQEQEKNNNNTKKK